MVRARRDLQVARGALRPASFPRTSSSDRRLTSARSSSSSGSSRPGSSRSACGSGRGVQAGWPRSSIRQRIWARRRCSSLRSAGKCLTRLNQEVPVCVGWICRRLWRVQAPAGIQGADVWSDGGPGGPPVSLEQDLFLLRFGQVRTGAVGADLPLRRLRLHPGQGPERRPGSRETGRGLRGCGLWGTLWPGSREPGETGPREAGTGRHGCAASHGNGQTCTGSAEWQRKEQQQASDADSRLPGRRKTEPDQIPCLSAKSGAEASLNVPGRWGTGQTRAGYSCATVLSPGSPSAQTGAAKRDPPGTTVPCRSTPAMPGAISGRVALP